MGGLGLSGFQVKSLLELLNLIDNLGKVPGRYGFTRVINCAQNETGIFEMRKLFEIVYEDADLLVINKPADLVCHPTKGDQYSSLISRVRLHLGDGADPHMINRLDRETSGLVLVAKTTAVAVPLRKIWEARSVVKEYLAIVQGQVVVEQGIVSAPLGKDLASRVVIKDCVREDGAEAQTEFWRRQTFSKGERDFSLLKVIPRTGRKHQIRIHLSYYGHPIVGDKLYGPNEDFYLALVEGRLTDAARAELILPYHALHANRLCFTWQDRRWEFHAAPEPWFAEFAGL